MIKATRRLGRHGGFRSLQDQRWLLTMAQPFRITATKSTFHSLTNFFASIFLIKLKLESTSFAFSLNTVHFFWKQEAIFASPPP